MRSRAQLSQRARRVLLLRIACCLVWTTIRCRQHDEVSSPPNLRGRLSRACDRARVGGAPTASAGFLVGLARVGSCTVWSRMATRCGHQGQGTGLTLMTASGCHPAPDCAGSNSSETDQEAGTCCRSTSNASSITRSAESASEIRGRGDFVMLPTAYSCPDQTTSYSEQQHPPGTLRQLGPRPHTCLL